MAKQPKSNRKKSLISKKSRNRLIFIPFIAFVIKLVMIARIQGFDWFAAGGNDVTKGISLLLEKNYVPAHMWYGADGENYLRGLAALARDGFFSTERNLHYWPAGYPLLMWPLLLIFKGSFFFALATLQSLFYALGCAFFVNELRQTRLTKFAPFVAIFLTFNPTLTLNTLAIGYELPTVSLSLIAMGALLRNFRLKIDQIITSDMVLSGICFMLASFMQPRLIVIALGFFVIWGVAKYRFPSAILFVLLSFLIVSLAPATMIVRNSKANGFAAISTNLGVTMGIGAGPEATGGYNGKYNGVPCPAADRASNAAKADNEKVKCILDRKSTRLNSSHVSESRMPSSA